MTEQENARLDNFRKWYEDIRPRYKKASEYVYEKLSKYLTTQHLEIAHMTFREKTIDSAWEKAGRVCEDSGKIKLKYSDPKTEIMDFAAVRVVTYLSSDLKVVTDSVEKLFSDCILYDESENKIESLGRDRVGYLSIHYVITIETDEREYSDINDLK